MGEVSGREQEGGGGESKNWHFPENSLSTCSEWKEKKARQRQREREIGPVPHRNDFSYLLFILTRFLLTIPLTEGLCQSTAKTKTAGEPATTQGRKLEASGPQPDSNMAWWVPHPTLWWLLCRKEREGAFSGQDVHFLSSLRLACWGGAEQAFKSYVSTAQGRHPQWAPFPRKTVVFCFCFRSSQETEFC